MKKEEERTKAINKNITRIQDWFQLVQFPPDVGQLTTTRRKLTGGKRMAWTADLVGPRLGSWAPWAVLRLISGSFLTARNADSVRAPIVTGT